MPSNESLAWLRTLAEVADLNNDATTAGHARAVLAMVEGLEDILAACRDLETANEKDCREHEFEQFVRCVACDEIAAAEDRRDRAIRVMIDAHDAGGAHCDHNGTLELPADHSPARCTRCGWTAAPLPPVLGRQP